MITFECALTKARELKPEIDNYAEYELAYVFGCKADNQYIGIGPCVILKENGDAVSMAYAITNDLLGKEIKGGNYYEQEEHLA